MVATTTIAFFRKEDSETTSSSTTKGREVCGAGTAVIKLPKKKRVIILGSGPTDREAPIEEARAAGTEIWGLNAVHRKFDPWLFTRFFQIHRKGTNEGHIDEPDHEAWLKSWGTNRYKKWVEDWGNYSPEAPKEEGHKDPAPIYMISESDQIPASIAYPIEEVAEKLGPMGRKYFTNTIDFMLALAIYEGFNEVFLYGIDLTSDGDGEYTKMRQSLEYYVGVMHGRGIEYFIPQRSALCKADRIYGYEEKSQQNTNLLKLLQGMTKEIDKELKNSDQKRVESVAEVNACRGGLKALDAITTIIERRERGSQF